MVYRDQRDAPNANLVPPAQPVPGLPPQAPQRDLAPEDASPLDGELVGDIPPPPAPVDGVMKSKAPKVLPAPNIAGLPGAQTFARPGSAAAMPFHSAAFTPPAPPLAGPGVAVTGGLGAGEMSPDDLGELLKQLAMRQQGGM